MRWFRVVFSGAVFAAVLACSGLPAPAAPPAPAPPPASAPGFHTPGLPALPAAVGAPSEIVAHYLADCHYREMVDNEDGPGQIDECKQLDFEQNCGEDISGCWDKGQKCTAACADPCMGCQDGCANACDGCKQGCNGDPTCQRGCAERRSACRTGCLAQESGCTDGCRKAEGECGTAWDKQVAADCPDCDAIRSCVAAHEEDCQAKFHSAKPDCFGWCSPYN